MSRQPLLALLVAPEVSPLAARLHEIVRSVPLVTLEPVPTVEAGVQRLDGGAALVLLDVETFGALAGRQFQAADRTVPIVALLTARTESLAGRAWRAGAADYLLVDTESGEEMLRRLLAVAARARKEREGAVALAPGAAAVGGPARSTTQATADALFASVAHLRAVFEHAPVGLAVSGLDSLLLSVNSAFARLLGYRPEELQGIAFQAITHPEDVRLQAPLAAELAAGRRDHYQIEKRYRRKDGTDVWANVVVILVRDDAGRPAFSLGMINDISDRKAAEQRLESFTQVEQLRALAQLANSVAHGLNQQLGLVVGHGELTLLALERGESDPDQLRRAVQTMLQAALAGADAVRRLQRFARAQEEAQPEPVDLAGVLRETIRLTAPRWRDRPDADTHPIHVELAVNRQERLVVSGWEASLREVFIGLVLNAVDALPAGGEIRLRAARAGDSVVVEVADTGTGMTPEVKQRAFEPFFSTKGARGSGLGLSIVFAVVQRHGGQISLDTEPGRGTTVRLRFPVLAEAEPAGAAHEPSGPLRVLVVDDEPALAELLATLLRVEGHGVTTAESGEAALDLLAARPFDFVFSDLGLGEGIDGWALAQRVRASWPNVRFVVSTGWEVELEPAEAWQRGVLAVLNKPYRLEDFRRILATNRPT